MDEPHVGILPPPPDTGVTESIIKFIEEKVAEICEILGINIDNVQHLKYHDIYTFSQNDKTQRVQIYYNRQNKITRVNCIDNDVLVDLMDELKRLLLDVVVYNNQDNENQEFAFTETFLKEFYNVIKEKVLTKNISIIDIKHRHYCERYTFQKEEKVAVIDFWYNGSKQFKKAPQSQKDSVIELVNEIYEVLR